MTLKSFKIQGQVEATNIVSGVLTAGTNTDAKIEVSTIQIASNWWSMYGDLDFNITNEYGAGSVYDTAGNLYVVGTWQDLGGVSNLLLLKYDANGTLIWSKSYSSISDQIQGESVIYDAASGHLFVLTSQEYTWFGVIEMDTNGEIIRQVHGDVEWEMNAWDLTIDSSGNIYIIGDKSATNDMIGSSQVVVKLDATNLNFVWGKEFSLGSPVSEPFQGKGFGAIEYSNGYVYVTGGVNDSSNNYSYIAKLDAVTGDQVWLQDSNGGEGMGLCLDDSDNVYTTLIADAMAGLSVISKFNSAGVFQWSRGLMFFQGGGDVDINYDNGYVYATGAVYDGSALGPTYNGSLGAIHWAKVDATTGDIIYQQVFSNNVNPPLEDVWRFKGHDLGAIHNGKLSIAAYAFESTATSGVPANMITLQLPLTAITTGTYGQYLISDFIGDTGTFTTSFTPAVSGLTATIFTPASTEITNITTSTVVVDNTLTSYTQIISEGTVASSNTWTFGTSGILTIPGNIDTNQHQLTGSDGFLDLNGDGSIQLTSNYNGVDINLQATDGIYNHAWKFKHNGILELPNGNLLVSGQSTGETNIQVIGDNSFKVYTHASVGPSPAWEFSSKGALVLPTSGGSIINIAPYDTLTGFYGQTGIVVTGGNGDARFNIDIAGNIQITNPGTGYESGIASLTGGTRITITTNSGVKFGDGTVQTSAWPGVLNDLIDVDSATPTNGDVLQYNSSLGQWKHVQLDVGSITLKGTWDANANTPTLSSSQLGAAAGWEYLVSVTGTQDLGLGNTTYNVGDLVLYDGTNWNVIPGSASVVSFNTRVGAVILSNQDVTTALGYTPIGYNGIQITTNSSGTQGLSYNNAGVFTFTPALDIAGNAATATKLAAAVNINGVAFDGSGSITVTAAAGTLSGNTLASGVTSSSLTSVGTLTNLTVTNPIVGTVQNGVVTTGSYSDPSWITSLAYSKLTGTPSSYTLTTATAIALGGVKIGSGITVAADGTISVASSGGGVTIGTTTIAAGSTSTTLAGLTSIDGATTATVFTSPTTLTLGNNSNSTSTINIANGAVATGITKTINIGTGGIAGGTTAITLGTTLGTSTLSVNGTTTFSSSVKFNGYLQSAGGASMLSIGNSDIYVNGNVRMNTTSLLQFGSTGGNYAIQNLPNATNGSGVTGTGAVVLDIWKFYVPSSGNRGLNYTRGAGAVDASFIGSAYWVTLGAATAGTLSGTTSSSWQPFNSTNNFSNGDVCVYTFVDTTNSKTYRVTVVYTSATNSSITAERIA